MGVRLNHITAKVEKVGLTLYLACQLTYHFRPATEAARISVLTKVSLTCYSMHAYMSARNPRHIAEYCHDRSVLSNMQGALEETRIDQAPHPSSAHLNKHTQSNVEQGSGVPHQILGGGHQSPVRSLHSMAYLRYSDPLTKRTDMPITCFYKRP